MNSISQASFATQWAVAVQGKVLDSAKDQGEGALKLIEASAGVAKASQGSVGTRLHVVG